ncbi:hypothetical protein HU200_015335 [Digitaria exilis]|uniref:Protein POLAR LOCALIZATION DURING ASYMMETRIC DIVISION AND REDISTRIBUTION n=1 Tax=Digitaria exilis TaxID=1010633 RepID=A0A835FAS5_9POAL|nr:hypothetical protein HU200_015335 [Digitaria exilis]
MLPRLPEEEHSQSLFFFLLVFSYKYAACHRCTMRVQEFEFLCSCLFAPRPMENCVRGRAGGRVVEAAGSLPLPPPPRMAAANSSATAAAASIRAHLARSASGVDAQPSPRSLLSRILLRGGGGDGGSSGGGFGCRVRLPRRYGGGLKEERKEGSEQGETPRVKVVAPPPPPEMPLDTPRRRKKPEEELVSMNLGLGASLVLLLSKSAVELNKMVELRAQMEALVSEIRQASPARWKENATNHSAGAGPAASASQESNGSISSASATTTAVKDPIAFPAADADVASNCSRTTTADDTNAVSGDPTAAAVVIDQLEAELQAELQAELGRMQMQRAAGTDRMIPPMQGLEVRIQLPLLKVKTKATDNTSSRRRVVDDGGDANKEDGEVVNGNNAEEQEEVDDEEEEEEYEEADDEDEGYDEDGTSPPHGGVSARALERRLHELLQKRQQERIVELESALDNAQRRLHEKEREVVWWRDAAKLVTHRRDEQQSRRFQSRQRVARTANSRARGKTSVFVRSTQGGVTLRGEPGRDGRGGTTRLCSLCASAHCSACCRLSPSSVRACTEALGTGTAEGVWRTVLRRVVLFGRIEAAAAVTAAVAAVSVARAGRTPQAHEGFRRLPASASAVQRPRRPPPYRSTPGPGSTEPRGNFGSIPVPASRLLAVFPRWALAALQF